MKAVRRILLLASIVLVIGISISYYNTSSFGYDDANLLTIDNNEIKILNININYKNIAEEIQKAKKLVPDQSITI